MKNKNVNTNTDTDITQFIDACFFFNQRLSRLRVEW